MKNVQSYNKELEIATAQFKDVFNNLKIFIFKKDNSIKKEIIVPVKYAAKSIALKELENRKKNVPLPVIAFNKTGLSVDTDRYFNINNDLLLQQDNILDYTLYQPVAIDIQFEMTFFSLNPREDDQMIQHWIPFASPNFYVAWKHPYLKDTLKSQVIWDGQISTEFASVDYDGEAKQRIQSTTSFIYKTWLFAGSALTNGNGPKAREDLINTVITDFYSTDNPTLTYDSL